ncbi:FAD-dependent oxidoreductase [Streptomyces sp. ISL-100]|uniref:FAD-dependent oxidoreductase n=1 Tax=Streptomyces sp. ISL-100 TaxID=2819173 RepID=UPI001BE931E6|nr:FAD-dependent oxidoreductase [Streptomyces sp. ISL-100]MBT2396899.1 FAD-binding oxidoreductase [Streptomyces sp. ISL-100]
MAADDFHFLHGEWTVANRRLKTRLAGADDWEEFGSKAVIRPLFGGGANIEEIHYPTADLYGLTLRLYDSEHDEWSLNWATSAEGKLFPPVVGRFTDGVGRFEGEDEHEGTPVRVRFVWSDCGPDSARWQQSFSADGGATWELNWIMDFTRTAPAGKGGLMRIAVVGGGLLGTLLAWRLATTPEADCQVDLWVGGHRERDTDATSHSGGMVRAYAGTAADSVLAARSLAELRSSPTLCDWSGYHEVGSVVVQPAAADTTAALAAVEDLLPGHVELVDRTDLSRRYSLGGLPEGSWGIVETHAGYLFPDRLRDGVLTHLPADRVRVLRREVASVATALTVRPANDGPEVRYDAVVLATGPWTPTLLARSGLSADGYRTKQIQYTWCTGWPAGLGVLMDETSGLYGRPAPGGGMIGVPTDLWDIDPAATEVRDRFTEALRSVAEQRLPGSGTARGLAVGARTVPALDCYYEQPGAVLRQVEPGTALYTFAGGSGGAAKTALFVSRLAAADLLDGSVQPTALS